MKMNKQGKIEWLEILFWIIMIILFIMVLTRVFGSSATEIQIYIGFISGFIVVMGFIAKHHREIGVMKSEMKRGFEKVRGSFDKVKGDMDRIESKIDSLLNKSKRGK